MFENLLNFFKKKNKKEEAKSNKDTAKERLHLVLMQDRANVSADFLEMMKQEIIDVIKKYVNVDEDEINVTLTNQVNSDGTTGAPALYANIPIKEIKNEARSVTMKKDNTTNKKIEKNEQNKGKQEKSKEIDQNSKNKDAKKLEKNESKEAKKLEENENRDAKELEKNECKDNKELAKNECKDNKELEKNESKDAKDVEEETAEIEKIKSEK